jgi:hypothetical protein
LLQRLRCHHPLEPGWLHGSGKRILLRACTARTSGITSNELRSKFISPPAEAAAPPLHSDAGDYPIGTIAYYGPDDTEYFLWLAHEGLEREHSQVWNDLAATSANIEALPVFPELRRAFDEGLIETGFMGRDELDEVETSPRGSWLARYRDRHSPISDVARETSWWQCFQDDPAPKAERENFRRQLEVPLAPAQPPGTPVTPKPYRAAPKFGRNDPCPCGSGKKYKKCCGQ